MLEGEGVSASHQTVALDIKKALAETAEHRPERETYRELVLQRYERILQRNWTTALDELDDLATRRVMNALKEIRQIAGLDLPPDAAPPLEQDVRLVVSWDDGVGLEQDDE